MLNIKVVTWSLAIWTTFPFLFCVAFAMLTPQSLAMHALLLQVLAGFEWFSWRRELPLRCVRRSRLRARL